jgi:ABC-2 type transport system permease protein
MLSGYLVPISTLPRFLQWVSVVIPLRHYLTVVRGIMLKGAGIGPILPEVGILALITVVGVWIATRTLSRVSE